MSPVIHGSHVPQFIEVRDPDEMMNEEGLILFWSIMIGMAGGPLVVAAICAAPAFCAWIAGSIATCLTSSTVLIFILTLVTDYVFDQYQLNKMMEKMTPEECTGFFCSLQEYIDESGLDIKPETIIYNDDGTITVKFVDGSVQTFRKVEGTWVPIPTNPSSEEA